MKEIKPDEFEWNELDSMVQVLRAEMSTRQFQELKALAALNRQTLQKFVGGILKREIRNSKKQV